MKSAATPTQTESAGRLPPKLLAACNARKAQSTPERFEAMVLLSPVVLPPAAKKHPHATIPAQTGKAATPSATYVHPVIRIPMLMASATSASMGHLRRKGTAMVDPVTRSGERPDVTP